MFLHLIVEIRPQLLFPEGIVILEPLDGQVLLLDLLLEHLDGLLVPLPSCFLALRSVLGFKPELLHLFVHPNLLVHGLISLLDEPWDLPRPLWQERRYLTQFSCLLHQLLRRLDVAGAAVLAEVDGLPDLDHLVVQVSVDLLFDKPLGLQVLLGLPDIS